MKQKQTQKILLFLSIVFMFLFSASFLLMPIASQINFQGKSILMFINGLWFWITGIIAMILFIIVNQSRKKQLKNTNEIDNNKSGFICFFTNSWAKAADCLFLISLIGLIILIIILPQSYFVFIFAFITVFAFLMHCVLNGKNYKYIIRNLNQKKSDQSEKYDQKGK